MAAEDKAKNLETMRHSASHVMAEAVKLMFPTAKFGIGPAIEDGFYYDFDLPRPLTLEDLPEIEAKMQEIIKADEPFMREEISTKEALKLFADQPYKIELIKDLGEDKVSVYRQGSFTDLCRGPHVKSSGAIKAFKLTSVAGAYWRGDEKRPMLQRIYGVAFAIKSDLEDYLKKSRKLPGVITANWARSLICIACTRKQGRAWSTGTPRAELYAKL